MLGAGVLASPSPCLRGSRGPERPACVSQGQKGSQEWKGPPRCDPHPLTVVDLLQGAPSTELHANPQAIIPAWGGNTHRAGVPGCQAGPVLVGGLAARDAGVGEEGAGHPT